MMAEFLQNLHGEEGSLTSLCVQICIDWWEVTEYEQAQVSSYHH